MKRILFVLLQLITFYTMQAQNHQFWIAFTDKSNSPFRLDEPEKFLSERAVVRRNNQHIAVDSTDLPVNKAYLDELQKSGCGIICTSRWLNGTTITLSDTSAMPQIRQLPFVKKVELTKITAKNNAPSASKKLTAETSAGTVDAAILQKELHHLDKLHELGFSGQGIQIAVIDAGFYRANALSAFDSLFAQNRLLGTRDFVNPASDIYAQHSHGMSVLSILTANHPGLMVGSAPKASYWLLRTEDSAAEYPAECDYWISAAEFADSVGVDIINSSLGYSVFDEPYESYRHEQLTGKYARISQAATMAARKGLIVANSAGNEGNKDWHYIGMPADADSILTIGGVTAERIHSPFSSYGPTADQRIKPTVCSIATETAHIDAGGNVANGNGTSFASPIIAGLAACLWQAFPTLTNMELINLIICHSSQKEAPDNTLGYGVPNALAAYWYQTGLKGQQAQTTESVYPNPFHSELNIIHQGNTPIHISVHNPTGQKILETQSLFPIKLNTEPWQKGLYILILSDEKNTQRFKIIKH